ncbi:FKBP-type peptidyl-prolyl cis-trans isomerase [Microbacteriaceae bacterium VKM Ac-2854]|nr:FKBP-type peptidyl-prolyl cis-trans isomerase [Microbacteriaceae bacterium VKM Ac-2854]
MRRTAALIATVGLLAALTACSAPSSQADCTGGYSSGTASEGIMVTGDFGSKPDVTVPTPFNASSTQVSTLIPGSGHPIEKGSLVTVEATLVDGSTGEVVQSTGYDGTDAASIVAGSASLAPGISDSLLCAQVDSRIAVAISPDDAVAEGSSASADTPTVIAVFDIVSASLPRANGAQQAPQNNVPTVTLDEDGVPGIVKQNGDAPTTLQKATLKKGDGATVTADDTVTVNYTGWVWSSGEIFDSSWQKETPASFSPNNVIPGFKDALVGATVGSQVEVVIPPDQGYGDTAQGSIPAGSTLIFVVDILGIN